MPTAMGDWTSTSATAVRSSRCRAGRILPAGSTGTRAGGISRTSPTRPVRRGRAMRWARRPAITTATAAIDLFVTGWRDQRLYRNLGGGRFEDVTAPGRPVARTSGAPRRRSPTWMATVIWISTWPTTSILIPSSAPFCAAPDGRRDYCGPEDFPAQPDRLYRNNGDGTFTDVSQSAGIDLPEGRGLGVLVAELTGDNRPESTSPTTPRRAGCSPTGAICTFEEIGEEAGVARDGDGEVLSGMGVALGDLDGDGLLRPGRRQLPRPIDDRLPRPGPATRGLSRRVELAGADRRHAERPRLRARCSWTSTATAGSTCCRPTATCSIAPGSDIPFAMRADPAAQHRCIAAPGCLRTPPAPGSTGPLWAAAWRSATWTATAVPTSSPPPSTPPRAVLRNLSEGRTILSTRTGRPPAAGRPSGPGFASRPAGGSRLASSSRAAAISPLPQPIVWFGLGAAKSVSTIEVDWPWGRRRRGPDPNRPAQGRLRLIQGTGRPIR